MFLTKFKKILFCGESYSGWFSDKISQASGLRLILHVHSSKKQVPDEVSQETMSSFIGDFHDFEQAVAANIIKRFKRLEEVTILATVIPFVCRRMLEIKIANKNCPPHKILLLRWGNGKILENMEMSKLIQEDFLSRPGNLYHGIKFVQQNELASEKSLAAIEKKYKVILPDEYKSFILSTNGGRPAVKSVDPEYAIFFTTDIKFLNSKNCNIYASLGLISIADAGQGCGGHTSIFCKPGKHYGKIFKWYYDCTYIDPDKPIDDVANQEFLRDNFVANDFDSFLTSIQNAPDWRPG